MQQTTRTITNYEFIKHLKACFAREPYLTLIRNRNQRSSLTRLRISAHTLATEIGRSIRPKVPFNLRLCEFCTNSVPNQTNDKAFIDTELHFLVVCDRFKHTREKLFNQVDEILPGFKNMGDTGKFLTLLCPTNPKLVKVVSRCIEDMFIKRQDIKDGGVAASP